MLLFHFWQTISSNIETVVVIPNSKGKVNVFAVSICILILTYITLREDLFPLCV